MAMEILRDPGLQPERTGLAWQRVALAVMVCSALVARSFADTAVAAVAVLAGGLLAAVVMTVTATRRERGTVVQAAGGVIGSKEDSGQAERTLVDHIAGSGKRFALVSLFSIVLCGLGLVAVLL